MMYLWMRALGSCFVFSFVSFVLGTSLTCIAAAPSPFRPAKDAIKSLGINSTFHSDLNVRSIDPARTTSTTETHKQLAFKALHIRTLQAIAAGAQATANQKPSPVTKPAASTYPQSAQQGFRWKAALKQSLLFLTIEHAFRLSTEEGTRAELKGPFFKDWFKSVRSTRNWRDGDPMLVNYIGHPMQGAVTGYIFVHNDPSSVHQEIGLNKTYVKSRLKAMLFSTVYSTQFELGPISEASIGNVGIRPTRTSQTPSAYVDLVITPTLGAVWQIGEDALDRFVVQRMEKHVENRVARLLVRSFLNPARSFANIMRGRWMWHRDTRKL